MTRISILGFQRFCALFFIASFSAFLICSFQSCTKGDLYVHTDHTGENLLNNETRIKEIAMYVQRKDHPEETFRKIVGVTYLTASNGKFATVTYQMANRNCTFLLRIPSSNVSLEGGPEIIFCGSDSCNCLVRPAIELGGAVTPKCSCSSCLIIHEPIEP